MNAKIRKTLQEEMEKHRKIQIEAITTQIEQTQRKKEIERDIIK